MDDIGQHHPDEEECDHPRCVTDEEYCYDCHDTGWREAAGLAKPPWWERLLVKLLRVRG